MRFLCKANLENQKNVNGFEKFHLNDPIHLNAMIHISTKLNYQCFLIRSIDCFNGDKKIPFYLQILIPLWFILYWENISVKNIQLNQLKKKKKINENFWIRQFDLYKWSFQHVWTCSDEETSTIMPIAIVSFCVFFSSSSSLLSQCCFTPNVESSLKRSTWKLQTKLVP